MKRSYAAILFSFLFLNALCSYAQFADSLSTYLHSKPTLAGDLGSIQTFFYGFKAPIEYTDAGLSFAGRVRIGIGYSKLKTPDHKGTVREDNSPFYINKYFINSNGENDTVTSQLHFNYFVFFMEYVFYRSKHWEFSVPFRFGFGKTFYECAYNGDDIISDKHFAFIYRPSVSFDYRICRWVGFNTEIGYKFTLSSQKSIRSNFSSPTYNFGFFIYYSELWKVAAKQVKRHKEKKQRKDVTVQVF
jgi:hypothetical protein